MSLLKNCTLPSGISKLSLEDKKKLATEVRERIIRTVAKTGGHLAPSLGTVELTIALLSQFDPLEDKIIWDVGHQTYAWKILTDRNEKFDTLRQMNGLSGFSKPFESKYDHFIAGHASTSISAALGKAFARDLVEGENHVIAVIGDGALTGGMAYEALNQAGELGKRLIVILNDNAMSISPNVGSLSRFISGHLSTSFVVNIKKYIRDFFHTKKNYGRSILNFFKRGERSFKSFFTPGSLFEAFEFNYIGPVDGHNIEQLEFHLKKAVTALSLTQPVLLHIKTQKGKGYTPAENSPSRFHAVSGFEPESGLIPPTSIKQGHYASATEAFSQALLMLGKQDEKIVAITAAMTEGTGLLAFKNAFPDRFVDVGICEQHAVTFAAGLASEGFKPIVAIYSTFLQRAYDQIIHDVALQKLPVIFCIDRAGLVGEDGPTHHGAFDLTYLRSIPEMYVFVPTSPTEILNGLYTALHLNAPFAMRYPRSSRKMPLVLSKETSLIPVGEGYFMYTVEDTNSVSNICIVGVGAPINYAQVATEIYYERYKEAVPIFNALWVKPLPTKQLDEIAEKFSTLLLVEENTKIGGFTSGVLEYYSDTNQIHKLKIKRLALPDIFVEHGKAEELREKHSLNSQGILIALEELRAN